MKNVFTILLVLISLKLFSQPFINYTPTELRVYAAENNYDLEQGYTESDSTFFIILEADDYFISCYFSDDFEVFMVKVYSFTTEVFTIFLNAAKENCIELKGNEWIRYFDWGVVHTYLEVFDDLDYPTFRHIREVY